MASRSKVVAFGAAIAATALALAGCSGGAATPDPTTDPDAVPTGDMTLFWTTSQLPGIQAVIDAFVEEYPEVNVTVNNAAGDEYFATLATQLNANTAPDVFVTWPGKGNPGAITQLVPGGFLQDLSDQSWVSEYPEPLVPLSQIDGKTYIMMPIVTSFGPWYNEQALEESGLEAPQNWDDIIPFCEDARALGKTAYAVGAQVLSSNPQFLFSQIPGILGSLQEFNEKLADGDVTFENSRAWKDAIGMYSDMIDAGCYNDNATGLVAADQDQLVASGQAFGTFSLGFRKAALQALAPDVDFVLHELSKDGNADAPMALSSAGGAGINAHAKNSVAANAFVEFLADNLELYAGALLGTVPTLSDEGYQPEDPSLLLEVTKLRDGQSYPFFNQDWDDPKLESVMSSNLQALLLGQATVEDVLKAMDVQYQSTKK